MNEATIREAKDAPGPFYTEYGCCTACMAPHAEAPEMMGFDEEEGHCYIRQQPQSTVATYRAIRALWSSEFGCLRYAGGNPAILRRLGETGLADLCDQAIPLEVRPLLRNHVTFSVGGAGPIAGEILQPEIVQVAGAFSTHIQHKRVRFRYTVTPLQVEHTMVTFALSWGYEAHEMTITAGEASTNRLLISHSPTSKDGSQAVSLILDDWLRSDPRFTAIRWYTAQAWHNTEADWQETPV